MNLTLTEALRYAAKPKAGAADYHKGFDRLAADPKAEEGLDAKSLPVSDLYAEHLRSEGLQPQADFIQQAMQNAKAQGEPVVYSESIGAYPDHHRASLESLSPGEFHLFLGKPEGDYTTAALYQRSHTDPSKVFGWTDSIAGTPEEVKGEVERFQRAGTSVDMALRPDHPQYQKWANHFGLGGYSEEPEQYAKKKRSLEAIYGDFTGDTDTEGWTEQEKAGLNQLNKAEQSAMQRGFMNPSHLLALSSAYTYHARKGNSNLVKEIADRFDFLKVPKLPHTEGEELPFDSLSMVTDTGVSDGQKVKVLLTGYHNKEQIGEPLIRSIVTPEDKSLSQMDLRGSRYSSEDRPVRYSAVPQHEIHADYAPEGVAPRIGHLLQQLSQEDSDAGLLAEGIVRTGSHDLLPILADRLEETEHPLAQVIDWRHAPRAMRIDRALHRQIAQRQVRHPDGHRVPLTAGWVLADIQDGIQRPAFSKRKALLTARLAQPDATTEDVLHSLFRLMDHREVADTAPELVSPVADHTKALTQARLQRLGQRPLDPYKYTDLRPENNRKYSAKPVRYSHEAFQQAVAKDPNDWTSGLVYADWLDEQGMPNHARVVREGAGIRQAGWGALGQSRKEVGLAGLEPHNPLSVSALPLKSGRWIVTVRGKHLEGHQPEWNTTVETEDAKSLVKGLLSEGADNHILNLDAFDTLMPKEEEAPPQAEPDYRDRKKYESWRAPAGGMVVQQSPLAVSGQWAKGGQFINDLTKDPVDYKKQEKQRKRTLVVEYLKKRWRAKKRSGGYSVTQIPSGMEPEEGTGE